MVSHATTSSPAAALPGTLRLGAVHLTVTDVDRSVGFYQDVIGLQLRRSDVGFAAMGAGGEDLVVLHEDPAARPAGRHAGLYHFALLFPSRDELAHVAVRLGVTRTPIEGASDHETHEAIYLPDPDGNGIELAWDRPREQWPESLGYAGGPKPLDVHGLLDSVAGVQPRRQAGPGLKMGHVHLHVGDIGEGLRFYRDKLGFGVKALMPSAAFVAAGDYHHHLAFNTWKGEGVPGAPEGTVGLRHWTIVISDLNGIRERVGDYEERDGGILVRDPWGTAVLIVAAG